MKLVVYIIIGAFETYYTCLVIIVISFNFLLLYKTTSYICMCIKYVIVK